MQIIRPDMDISHNIQRLRRNTNMTQDQVVAQLQLMGIEISKSTYAKLETNRMNIKVILSRLVDTFISRISLTMLPVPNPHNTVCVLSWEEARHWQSRSSGYSSS